MRILGVDPGTITMGYGVIDGDGDSITLVDYGAIDCPQRSPLGERLCILYTRLSEVISRFKPEVLAVEQPFFRLNAQSALAIGKAQAVALLAAAQRGMPIFEYSPAQVKKRVADYGAGSKEQIQQMVRLQLGLTEVPEPDDAADALAVAICHLREACLSRLLAEQEKRQ